MDAEENYCPCVTLASVFSFQKNFAITPGKLNLFLMISV
jgi:hypothetical protein